MDPKQTDLSLEEAEQLQEIFGPCTALNEAMTPEEVVAAFKEHHNLGDYIQTELSVESILLERSLGFEPTEKEIAEKQRFEAEIIQRVKDAGLYVKDTPDDIIEEMRGN
jgi:hypothetical protein